MKCKICKEREKKYGNLCDNCHYIYHCILNIFNRKKLMRILGDSCKCGETNHMLLDIDHIRGGGRKEKERFRKQKTTWMNVYLNNPKLARKNLQLLCVKCHRIKTYKEQWSEKYFPLHEFVEKEDIEDGHKITYYLKKYLNIKPDENDVKIKVDFKRIIKLKNRGNTLESISNQLGVSLESIRRILIKNDKNYHVKRATFRFRSFIKFNEENQIKKHKYTKEEKEKRKKRQIEKSQETHSNRLSLGNSRRNLAGFRRFIFMYDATIENYKKYPNHFKNKL